jgi:hypothetical protein
MPSVSDFTELVHTPTGPSGGSTSQPVQAHGPSDPFFDVLLARKERQLQKKRTGRRLWQDLIVFVGIFPVGGLAAVWTSARLLGIL